MMEKMAIRASVGVDIQSGREYGFGTMKDAKRRATRVYEMDEEELEHQPVHNLVC